MPEVDDVFYIINLWRDVGLAGSGAYGPIVISSQEINAWQQGACVNLSPWEFNTLREMSRAYIASLHAGENPDEPAPYGKSVDQVDRDSVDKKIRSTFRAFMQKTTK